MVKPLILVASLANIFFLVSTGTVETHSRSSAYSSSGVSSSQSYASASTGEQYHSKPVCSNSESPPSDGGPPPCHPPQPSCRVNEIWSNCPIAVCSPKTCKDVGFPVACPDLLPNGKCPVKPGCICREGFVRNHAGICIPLKHCPSCGGDPNAEHGCGTNCNRLCSNYNQKPCACTQECIYNGCECRPGFVYDEIKMKCVFSSDCSYKPCTKKNEVFDTCPAPCPFRTCGIDDAAISCVPAPYPGDPNCAPPKCRCKDGFFRNDVGECVLWEECPVCWGLNEIYDPCPATCPPQECGVNIALILCLVPPKLGDPECQPGCRCIDDHVRNHTGVCIPRDQCPTCPNPNEVYDPCIAPCPPRRCDIDDRLIKCAAPPKLGDPSCTAGCRCADGYYKNSRGVCVTREECPKCNGPNEYYACGSACDNVCATLHEQNQTNCPIINIRCNDMCYCDEGYARDKIGICIPINQCEPVCNGKHEVYSECIQGECRPKNCSQLGFPVPCPKIDPKYCKKGCLCKDGYARNKHGNCIPIDECPSCGGDCNAKAGCGVNCNRHCSDIGETPGFCIEICYENACDCKEGFYYDDNTKKCVHPKHCTPTCGPDEVYNDCIQGNCSPQNCSQLGFPIPCPRIDPKYCKKGCLCKEGNLRNQKGVCIPAKQCPSCGGDPNAQAGCGKNCGRLCSNYNKKGVVCTLECQINGCDCKDDYVYDTNTKKCVLPNHCTPVCRNDEVYSECVNNPCPVQNCSLVGVTVNCEKIDPKDCIKGCLCKKPLMREDNGQCVPISECKSKVCKKNEVYSECINGGCTAKNCSQIGRPVPCVKIDPKYCIKGCLCKEDYLRDDNGVCVPKNECKIVCKKNEVYSECINGGCNAKNCSQIGRPVPCVKIDPKYCIKGCLCKEDYLREDNGVCVPKNECKNKCNKPNEYYESCDYDCPPRTCESLDRAYVCPIREGDVCKSQCKCKEGFYKNKNGECITEAQCRQCSGPHEYFSCGGACDNVCATLQEQNQTNCPIINVKCNEKCYCEKNYARADNDTCIPIEKCKEPQCCKNERYEKCPAWLCEPQTCSEVGNPKACPDIPAGSKCPVKPACVCVNGYVKNDDGVCIPEEDCPEICSGKNEVYENCKNPICRPQKCSEVGYPLNCTDPPECKKCCVCKKGYVRSAKGNCIPLKNCPSCGGDKNAESGCGINCLKKCYDLQNPESPRPCPKICRVNACDCKKNFYYDENTKQCVPSEKCTKVCKKNEVYSECINGGCNAKNCSQIGRPVPCVKIDPKYCIKGCLCKEDYLREDNGVCVPKNECKNKCNKPNEYYESCDYDCPPRTCESLDRAYVCPIREGDVCKSQCKCKEGFYKNKNGECITEAQCRQCSGPHEYFSCGGACDNVCATLQEQNQTNCPIINVKCNEKCYCEKNYARADNDTCIPIEKCKEPQCCKNERYEKCPAWLCEPQTCSEVGNPKACPDIPAGSKCPVKPACVCVDGYVKNDDGVCIPEEDCPEICSGKNEVYENCKNPICRPQKCSEVGHPLNCTDPPECKKCCVCKEGYVRSAKGNCIPLKNCPSCGGDKNAESGCGINCLKKCYDLQNPESPRPCPKICRVNACDCKKNFYYDENTKQCVPSEKCTKVCKKNEVYSECINGGCTAKNCSQIGRPVPCVKIDPKYCIKGCLCKEDYLREDNGVCVPKNECKNKCNKPNEYYESCDYDCPPRTCESLDRAYVCPIREGDVCKSQCKCKEGFYKNKNGECITEAQCRQCSGPHEYFSCGGACDNVCATLQEQNQTNCPIINKKCNEKCYCEKDYARADNDTCIPIEKCKEPQCCKNERYEKCPAWLCEPQTCSEVGNPKACPDIPAGSKCPVEPACVCVDGYVKNDDGVCIPEEDCPEICSGKNEVYENCKNPICRPQKCSEVGHPLNCTDPPECKKCCVCKEGYVRSAKGNCIPLKNCPSCGGDKNAESGCGINCLKKCYDLQNPESPRPCPKICRVNACDCKKNFYYDENTKQCVPSEKCTPICDEDEIYDPCINGGCTIRNCSQIGTPKLCIDPIECKPGCTCKADYLRSKAGICIPIEKCPKAKCPKNERFEKCPAALCQPLHCSQLGYPIDCLAIEDDYCPGNPGCVCIDDYVRNEKEKCIPKRECPSCRGDHNAWSGCGVNCGKTCEDLIVKNKLCPRICKVNDCDCRDGFYYDGNTKKCVSPECCTPICSENEVFDSCVNGGCGHRNCSQINGPILCIDPIKCEGGCTCKENYLRLDETGVCVPKEECPNKCNKPNEEYVECPSTCPQRVLDGCPDRVNSTVALANFERGNTKLAIEFLNNLLESRPGENFMCSTLSVLIVLAQITIAAVGLSLEQLLRLLNLNSKKEVQVVFPLLLESLKDDKDIILKLANKIYGNEGYPFTDEFISDSEKYFKSSIENIDFSENVKAANKINEWVLSETNGLIKDLVKPDMFSALTRVAFFNCMYFLGNWVHPFNEDNTKLKEFYLNDEDTVSLQTMYQENRFKYGENENLKAKFLLVPYKGLKYNLLICLPDDKTGLNTLLKKFDADTIDIILNSLKYEKIQFSLPRMDFTADISNLKDLLMKSNLTAPFEPNDDFENIFKNNEKLFISDAVQKTALKVNEKGTEAAVATGIIVGTTSVQVTKVYPFEWNRPGAFFLMSEKTLLLCGVFAGGK